MNDITLSLVGDVLISKRLPERHYAGMDSIVELLNRHECRFGNLETTIHNMEGYPEAYPGGMHAAAKPLCLEDLRRFGFNLFSTANNHSMDYSHGGLLATIKYLDKYGIPYAGTGRNLADASRYATCDCSNGRIALLSVTSSFHDSYAAGPQNQDMQGRPGVSPLRHKAIYELEEKKFDALQEIAKVTGISDYHNQAIKEGFMCPSTNFKFGVYEFKKGERNTVYTYPLQEDLERTVNEIKDAKYFSDVVIVSVHSHQFKGGNKEHPAEFIRIFAKACIDAGADIIVMHGPHLLRGIEIYKTGIIFYSLGNFIFQYEELDVLPEEFYNKYGVTRQTTTGVGNVMNIKSKKNTIGLSVEPKTWKSVLVSMSIKPELMKVNLYPIELIHGTKGLRGLPVLSNDKSIIEHVAVLSKEFETNIVINNHLGYCEIKRN